MTTKIVPTFTFELKAGGVYRSIAGVDEVGVAPLAGPVVAAAVILDAPSVGDLRTKSKWWYEVRDSKQLSHQKREQLAKIIYEQSLSCGIGSSTVEEIDRLNILNARMLAMKRAVEHLKIAPDFIFVDGNKKIPEIFFAQEAVVKGDEKILSVACASIIAKVTRDNLLLAYHKEFPDYGFDQHKGYPTPLHYERLKKFGPCAIHRKTFAPVKMLLNEIERD